MKEIRIGEGESASTDCLSVRAGGRGSKGQKSLNLKCEPELQERRDLGEDLPHLGFDVAGLINDVDLALFLSAINARAGAAGPTVPQVGVGIVVCKQWWRRCANAINALYGIIPGVQEFWSVSHPQEHALGVLIEAGIRLRVYFTDSNYKHQNIVRSGAGTAGVACATISYQISFIHDAVGDTTG